MKLKFYEVNSDYRTKTTKVALTRLTSSVFHKEVVGYIDPTV